MPVSKSVQLAKNTVFHFGYGVLDEISFVLTEEERNGFYKSLSIISERLELVAKNEVTKDE